MRFRVKYWEPWFEPQKEIQTDWMAVTSNGYKVFQRRLREADAFGRKYERTYYRGAKEVMHEIGNYMTEEELERECEGLTELLQLLGMRIVDGD